MRFDNVKLDKKLNFHGSDAATAALSHSNLSPHYATLRTGLFTGHRYRGSGDTNKKFIIIICNSDLTPHCAALRTKLLTMIR